MRFATPNSQPKLSGHAGEHLGSGGVHLPQGPALGLKNFAPSAAMLHHSHGLHHASLLHGHHNLAMTSGEGTSGSSSSDSGSSVGGGGRHHHNHGHGHSHHQNQHQHHGADRRRSVNMQQHRIVDEDEDDYGLDEDGGEQGVLSSDEAANYLHRSGGGGGEHANEGFRDSNELTINADTALVANRAGQSTARRRIYSTNSIGRAGLASVSQTNRLSTGNISQQQQPLMGSHHHHHHHHHRHQPTGGGGSAGSSQHQRLVSSSTPSESTRSSRASPPSGDDQSLDRLAYGNGAGGGGWRPGNGSAAANQ